jgi:putative peptidoglycan lipid II flippase
VGVAAFQINTMVTQGLGFTKFASIVAIFTVAVRLMELPQGVFGISLATYLLPTLSGLAAEKKYPEFRATFRQAVSYLVFINLLASVLLLIQAEPIIRLLFERGKFTPQSTQHVSAVLMYLAPGLTAFSLVNIFARAFFALGDVKMPMRISMVCLTVNLILSVLFLFVLQLGAAGLGLANTMSSILNLGLLSFALRKKLKTLEMGDLRRQLLPVIFSGAVAGLLAWGGTCLWQKYYGHHNLWQRLGEVFLPMTVATAGYFLVAIWLKVPSAQDVFGLFRQRISRKSGKQA